eukprot:TRINITY_DN9251_c0_g2_i1.p1 TRINITY_DN9251_c0_g2~~TRINITY_DN9251_c0_g2_i1.p1  ORF type:complete len:394 (+),score=129.62 TRINITY_DN9251_c0_g2_i1:60-1241(+)
MPAMKRPAAAKAPAAAKKPKVQEPEPVDPVQVHCDAVSEGLFRSSETPTPVLNMLSSMAEGALRTCKDERHKYQESVVDMVAGILSGVEVEAKSSIEQIKEKIEGMGETRLQREATAQSADADVASKRASTQEHKHALAADAEAFKAAKEGLSAAQAAFKATCKELDAQIKAKERLQAILADFVNPLAEGTAEAGSAQRLATSLMASLSKLGLDESMMSAIPEAIVKEPSARGAFDTSVVSGLKEELDRRIITGDKDIAAKEPAKAEANAKVLDAQGEFEKAKEKQHKGATAYTEARDAQKAAEDALKVANKALADVDPEVEALQKELTSAEKDLEDFCNGPKHSFEVLRDRVLPPSPAPEPQEAETPSKAEAEAECGAEAETEGTAEDTGAA